MGMVLQSISSGNGTSQSSLRVAMGITRLVKNRAGHDGLDHYTRELYARLNVRERLPVAFGSIATTKCNETPVMRWPDFRWVGLGSALTGLPLVGGALSDKVDVFHSPDHFIPKLRDVPVVATLHDAVPISHPHWTSPGMRSFKNWLWLRSSQWAQHIITISEFSRGEIVRHFGIAPERITVVHNGVDERYFERIDAAQAEAAVSALNLPERFFLFVGTFQPRKNIERIVDAHEALPPALRKDFPLLIVGRNGWGAEALVARLNGYPQNGAVRWLQNVDDLAKRVMMQRATALVFPSLLEGFGLPVLEGFASQTPVITSNVTSLPEVAGDAAWMVDPYDVRALTEAMATLAREHALGQDLVAKGLQRARQFSWDACARKTVQVYEQVLSKS